MDGWIVDTDGNFSGLSILFYLGGGIYFFLIRREVFFNHLTWQKSFSFSFYFPAD